MKKVFTAEDIIADARERMEQVVENGQEIRMVPRSIAHIPPALGVKASKVKRIEEKIGSLHEEKAKTLEEASQLRKDLGKYLVENPASMFSYSGDAAHGKSLIHYADFSEVGGAPELPTGEEAKEVNNVVRNLLRRTRRQNQEEGLDNA